MSNTQTVQETLESGLNQLEIPVLQSQVEQFINLLLLLNKWNKSFNLTSVTSLQHMAIVHILDSLTLIPHLNAGQILDVGTGAGFPGLPLAIINPNNNFVLLDSNIKKTRFVRQATMELGLDNIEVVHSRIEHFQTGIKFDTVVARAVSTLANLVDNVLSLVVEGGIILLPKGQYPQAELADLHQCDYTVRELMVPGLDAKRHLVCIER